MITNDGFGIIGNTLADFLATHIAVGIGNSAESASDRTLEFETWRGRVESRVYDPTTNNIYLKTSIPPEYETSVLEVGLLTSSLSGSFSTMITTADSDETWTGGTWVTTGVRMGSNAINVAASTATLTGIRTNLSSFTPKDYIQVAVHGPVGGGTATLRIYTDDSNYVTNTFPVAAGYKIVNLPIETFTSTGTPDLANVTKIAITHSGAGSVTLDAMRAVKLNSTDVLIKRDVLAVPQTKVLDIPMDIEVPITI